MISRETDEEKLHICFLWIKEYKLIKNQSFNISSEYSIKYIEDTNQLIIKQNENYIHNFFPSNITDVTVLVGKNGSGKTTLVNFIKDEIHGLEGTKIIVYKKNDCFYIVYSDMENCPKVINDFNSTVKCFRYEKDAYNEVEKFERDIGVLNTIYYSNSFSDTSSAASKMGNYVSCNISTSFLVYERKNNPYVFRDNTAQIQKYFAFDNLLMINFLLNQNEYVNKIIAPSIRYIQFILRNNYKNQKDNKPVGIFLRQKLFKNEFEALDKDEKSVKEAITKSNEYRDKLLISLEKVSYQLESLRSDKLVNKQSLYFKVNTVTDLVYDYYQSMYNTKDTRKELNRLLYQYLNLEKLLLDDITISNFIDKITRFFQAIVDILDERFSVMLKGLRTKEEREEFETERNRIVGYMQFLNKLSCFDNKWIMLDNDARLIIEFSKDSLSILKDFYTCYIKLDVSGYYEFRWLNGINEDKRILSSGEEAMLKLYSRLYSVIDDIDKKDQKESIIKISNKSNNLLILLDEPEVYLHPHWQGMIVKRLLDFFGDVFRSYNIQLILTSNTPFLLSDLPRDNILLLEKLEVVSEEDSHYEIRVNSEVLPKSFGQNIHTLFREAFFMSNGTIGEYARIKINDIINILNFDSEENKAIANVLKKEFILRKHEIKKIIEIIGEPLIAMSLRNLYNQKLFSISEISDKEKLLEIDEEIERLKRIRNNLQKDSLSDR